MADPMVIYTAGMSGVRSFDRRFVSVLREAGLRVLVNRWCRSWWPLKNLRDRGQHAEAVNRLESMIARLREGGGQFAAATGDAGDGGKCGGEPVRIVLAGHSTGCLITLELLERLSEPVDLALLLAAAVRPDYDLSRALAGARRVEHFWSPLDPACSLGTPIAGTADGAYRRAAGAVGFSGPGSDDPRFRQHRYDPAWARHGHIGGHTTCFTRPFVRNVLTPLIRGEDPNDRGAAERASAGSD